MQPFPPSLRVAPAVSSAGVAAPSVRPPEPELVIEFGDLRPALLRATRLLLETAVVPTALLFLLMHAFGLVAGLAGVLGWCGFTVALRWTLGHRMPGTLLLCIAMLAGRATAALALSSAYLYLLQPALGSVLMAVLFVGSAAVGRPVTIRLARDFVSLPAHLFTRHGVHRMFRQVALMWGGSRLLDAVMSVAFLRWGVDAGLLSRGLFSGILTGISVIMCAYWGWRHLHRMPGITVRLRKRPTDLAQPSQTAPAVG